MQENEEEENENNTPQDGSFDQSDDSNDTSDETPEGVSSEALAKEENVEQLPDGAPSDEASPQTILHVSGMYKQWFLD